MAKLEYPRNSGIPDYPARAGSKRNPFPLDLWFPVPLRLLDDGKLRVLTGSELKRYLTLLRIGNYERGATVFQYSLTELEKIDGVSPRTAHHVMRSLQERGLLTFTKTKPLTATIIPPSDWPEPTGERPIFSHGTKILRQSGPKSYGVIL